MQMHLGADITLSFALDADGKFTSLGRTASLEEPNEIRIGTTGVGAETTDYVTREGIVILAPASYGASDMVSLEVPTVGRTVYAAPSSGLGLSETIKEIWQSLFF